jgi:hypothetical protein
VPRYRKLPIEGIECIEVLIIRTLIHFRFLWLQVASLVGLGLLYIESGNRHMAEVQIHAFIFSLDRTKFSLKILS